MLIIVGNDNHQSYFKWSWLRVHLARQRESMLKGPLQLRTKNLFAYVHKTWYLAHNTDGHSRREAFDSSIKNAPPSIEYEEVMSSDEGVAKWMRLIVPLNSPLYNSLKTNKPTLRSNMDSVMLITVQYLQKRPKNFWKEYLSFDKHTMVGFMTSRLI